MENLALSEVPGDRKAGTITQIMPFKSLGMKGNKAEA